MTLRFPTRRYPTQLALFLAAAAVCAVSGFAAERITLKNGFELVCDRHEKMGDRIRLYLEPASNNFVEVGAGELDSVESLTTVQVAPVPSPSTAPSHTPELSPAELREMLDQAGAQHNVDVDLLASVVQAESGGHTRAVSRAGAQGLMQLMPKTAADLGVDDSFRPERNISGGTAYLDALLTRYHDNLALALAAYNAGPAAVDRWHGIPPYRETQLYVARVIRQFNAAVERNRRAHQTKQAKGQIAAALAAGPGVIER